MAPCILNVGNREVRVVSFKAPTASLTEKKSQLGGPPKTFWMLCKTSKLLAPSGNRITISRSFHLVAQLLVQISVTIKASCVTDNKVP